MVSATVVAPGPAPIRPSVQLPAWLEVAKPRLIPLLLATTLGGMALSGGGSLSARTIACTLVGGSLASAAAGVLNCLWEQDLDGRMQRTGRRALPSGRLAQRQAFALAIGLTLLSVVVLVFGVNPGCKPLPAGALQLRAAVHRPAQAPHQPKHCDWRRRRGNPAAGRSCSRHRRPGLVLLVAVLSGDAVDASPLLGPGPAAQG